MKPTLTFLTMLAALLLAPPARSQLVKDVVVPPRRPVAAALDDAMRFLKKVDGGYVPGRLDGELDAYSSDAFMGADGVRSTHAIIYPARLHGQFIRTFLRYYTYTGDRIWLLRARDLADWNIARSTPSDAAWPHLAYSTFEQGKPAGHADKNSIQPDKAAFIGNSYLMLHETTGEPRYLEAAYQVEIHIKDFGAAGNGTADDTAALEKAVAALAAAPKPAVLRFEAGRTYRIATGAGYAIRLENQERIRIEGEGATLVLGADRRGVAVRGCRDVAVRGLRLDYDPLPFAEAVVTGVDRTSRAVVARIGGGFAMPPAGGPTKAGGEQAYFGMLWNPGPHALRSTHYWVADVQAVRNEPHSVSVIADKDFHDWNVIQPGTTRLTVPVRGIAHRPGAGAVIELDGNRDVALEDVEVWAAPWFAMVVQRNEGTVTLRRVQIRPRPGTARITSSWRDGLHVKGNRARLLFEDCVLDGMNDDACNIAAFLSRVAGVEGPRVRVRQNFPLGYVRWRAGDTLAGYATHTGTLLERGRVLAVEEEPGANSDHAPYVTLTLDRAVPQLTEGDQVWAVEAANPDTTLRRCTIRMSCRFQSRVTLEHCDVTALLWFYGEHLEGPLPSGSVVRHCRLRLGRGNPELAVACNGRINGLPAPAATSGTPPLADLQFEDNEIDGRFDLQHARKVQLLNNRFAPERGQLTLGDCREVLLQGNRLGAAALPATYIRIEDQATRDSLQEQ